MSKKCRCGNRKTPGQIVCLTCWRHIPENLRDEVRRASVRGTGEQRREAVRRCLDHLNGTPSML